MKLFGLLVDKSVYSPAVGHIVQMENIGDSAFSTGAMGTAIGIMPESQDGSSNVYAPFDAEILMVVRTKHALMLKRNDGLEALIHIGVDTVSLKGEGFNVLVEIGQKVKKGERLVNFSKQLVQDHGLDATVIFVVTNTDSFDIKVTQELQAQLGDEIMYARKKKE
ncbi:PTS sugar transporter subunit IIA [Paenibacillus polymyxa]|uniref:PTS sugar transporter subunit IIA n=1 Tax=Paenibacillus polymyxa TaxID=1406 RepID=UPI0032AFFC27